ncbi:mucin-5AC isoform X2 [Belonocnema kinseyi]|uniref:mucin-5AC isoform X2 n=1 Tax=Belonocnema kinseyi TaxID=2817044 RepID=UPI00143CF022|nr:mucin-5AC isoform X2 [Belonocnema kinseyi]
MDWKVRAFTLVLWLGLVLASTQNGKAEKRVVCYYTNWSVYRPGTAKFSPQNINPYLCTHLIYAFGGFTKDNTLKPFDKYQDIEKGGYAKFTGLKTYNKNLKTLLAIGGWNEGSSRFSPMVADALRRKEFVKNCVKFLRQNHFDGLDLDWEYPAFRDGGKPRDKENYATLVEELRAQFDRESLKTGRPRLLLTLAMPAGIEYIDKGYDVPRLNENLDFINLLSYDYHSAFEPAVNHHAPLYPLEEDNEYNYDTELTIEYTINHLIKSGASSDKIVLGIPTYGRSYTLFNEDSTDIGSPADGPGIEGDATREKGYLAYYEICESVEKGDWEVVQPNPAAMGPYAFKENQWVGYDDQAIVRAKAQYVNEKNLGGIMFWSIDNDDFRGKCHGRPYPLIEAAKEALLSDNFKHPEVKEKPSLRKPTRTQSSKSNSSGRHYATSNRRSTTTESPTRRRLGYSKPKNRPNVRVAEAEDEEETAVSDEEEEEEENRNTLKVSEKPARSRLSSKHRPRSRSTESNSRRKHKNRDDEPPEDSNGEESLNNKSTTPQPPTTPDPGSDFKCEDEGFFSHPRDCKKYFWCLDSGPSGLGIVGHQFTCPSGLVFNKAADSCDYPRNVVCPKVKSGDEATTTKAPTTAATTRTTTRRTTTEKPEPEEEYEYEDEDEDDEEEEEKAPKTTVKPLIYKTINRSRPSSTTTPTTTTPPSTITTTQTVKQYQEASEKTLDLEEEEDPRVIKELIDLIKKAGGIEHLEKQLLLQGKHPAAQAITTVGTGQVTPATISRSLYERVLNRQTSKVGSRFFGTSSPKSPENKNNEGNEGKQGNKRQGSGYTNGPGRAQFDGLDDLPEVKSLRRTHKPQYTTIERSRSSPSERIDESDDEEESDDNTDVASSEERSISNPPDDKSLLPRVTPSYVNIRRHRPTTTSKDDNDVEVKEEEIVEERPTRRRFSFISTRTEKSILDKEDPEPQRNSTNVDEADEVQSPTELGPSSKRTVFPNKHVNEPSTSKSRYTSIQRFRSTTEKQESNSEVQEAVTNPEVTTQIQNTSLKDTIISVHGSSEIPYTVSMTYSQSSSSSSSLPTSPLTTTSTTTTTTENPTTQYITLNEEPTPSTKTTNLTRSSYSSVKLVEDSATEILLTTSPSTSPPRIRTEYTTKETIAAVSQPRPFGFTRSRTRPSLTQTSSLLDSTTPLSTFATVPSRSKVASSESFQLPTLKQLIDHQNNSSLNNEEKSIRITEPFLRSSLSFPLQENSLRRSFTEQEVVDSPLQILDDKDDDPDKLLLLPIPENKLNRTILRTVLKLKIAHENSLEKNDNSEYEEGVSNTNLLTNELQMTQRSALSDVKEFSTTEKPVELERSASTYRGRSSRRRLRVDPSLNTSNEDSLPSQSTSVQTTEKISSQNKAVKISTKEHLRTIENATTQSTPLLQNIESSVPANLRAADIDRARRRRTRINSPHVPAPIHNWQISHTRGRASRRRNRVDIPESSSTLSITTSRGTILPETTSDFPRGFLLTKNTDDILLTKEDRFSTVGIESTHSSAISTIEKVLYSTKPYTELPTTTEYSESNTITSSPLSKDTNQEGESNLLVTTTEIAEDNEDYNQPIGTTTQISETTIEKLEYDETDMNTSTSAEISTTERASTLPHRYIKRKKIRKIKPVSSTQFSDLELLKSSIEDKNILLKKKILDFSEETTESSFNNPDSSFTILDPITFTTSEPVPSAPSSKSPAIFDAISSITSDSITLSTTSNPAFESTFFTTEAPSSEKSTKSKNLIPGKEADLKSPEITEASDFALTNGYFLLGTDDFIKPNSNFVEFTTERSNFFTTKLYVQEQTNSQDDFEKLSLETKDDEIRGNVITTEKGDTMLSTLSQFSDPETTSMSIDQNKNQTAASLAISSITNTSILNDAGISIQLNDQISTESPIKITSKVGEELISTSDRPTNGRRRVLKRKRQRIDSKREEKSMEEAKTETIEVTLKKNETSTTPAPISSSSIDPESEKLTRKRVVVYRGTRRFSSKTTAPTVQSSTDTRDHSNQIASRRRTKKVVRKRPKLSSDDNPESDLSTTDDESNRKDKHLSLDPETKSYEDADLAGSEIHEKSVNVYRSSPPTSRRPGSLYHREQSRIRSRASTAYQPLTTTQPTVRRFSSPSAGRQNLYFEETTVPAKIKLASLDDAAILLKHFSRIEDQRPENDDQTNRGREMALEDLETTPSTTEPGYSSLKMAFWRKISTTETPKLMVTTAIPAFRRRQGQKYYSGVVSQNLPQRPRRPAIVDYDYYEDEEIRFVGKPRLNGKLYVTSRGSITCLDQGNFPHPTSCRKFITCARMVNGQVVGTEYTCPEKLSFDPIGGICNWSAGLGCKE